MRSRFCLLDLLSVLAVVSGVISSYPVRAAITTKPATSALVAAHGADQDRDVCLAVTMNAASRRLARCVATLPGAGAPLDNELATS